MESLSQTYFPRIVRVYNRVSSSSFSRRATSYSLEEGEGGEKERERVNVRGRNCEREKNCERETERERETEIGIERKTERD